MKKFLLLIILLQIGASLMSQDKYLFWSDASSNKIQRSDLEGNNVETIINEGLMDPFDIIIDQTSGKLFWSDRGARVIAKSDTDGENIEYIVSENISEPRGLTIDQKNGKIYWVDLGLGVINQSNLDGTDRIELIKEGVVEPHDIEVDSINGKLYWSDRSLETIFRADLNGDNIEIVIGDEFLSNPAGIALNVENDKLYWTDSKNDAIQSSNLDGSNVETLVAGLETPFRIRFDSVSQSLFFTDYDLKRIFSYDLNDNTVDELLNESDGLEGPAGLYLYDSNLLNSDKIMSNLNSIQVYPNPVKDKIIIELNEDVIDISSIQILSLNGALIEQIKEYKSMNTKVLIQDFSLINGLYILRLSFSDYNLYERILVNK